MFICLGLSQTHPNLNYDFLCGKAFDNDCYWLGLHGSVVTLSTSLFFSKVSVYCTLFQNSTLQLGRLLKQASAVVRQLAHAQVHIAPMIHISAPYNLA